MIKFIHCADLHLDSPMSTLDITKSERRRNELRAAFTSLIMMAKMNSVDFLFIAGDLFDGSFVSRDTVALINHEFASIPECKIIISPGNHDPFSPTSYYRRGGFPDNVYVFDSPQVTSFDFPDKNTTVYGYAFTSDTLDTCPIEGVSPTDPSRINILVAHCDLDASESSYCPMPSAALAACGFDYAALGHRHAYTEPMNLGGGFAAYSGCLEGRGFDECGMKGAVLAAVEKDPQLKLASKFVRVCKRHYEIETLDVTGARSNADIIGHLDKLVADRHYGEDTALRVKLVGEVSGDFNISSEFLCERMSRLFILEIVDSTVPFLDKKKMAEDLTVRGEFYRSLAPLLESSDEKQRETAALALRCGLAALSGNDFSDFNG